MPFNITESSLKAAKDSLTTSLSFDSLDKLQMGPSSPIVARSTHGAAFYLFNYQVRSIYNPSRLNSIYLM